MTPGPAIDGVLVQWGERLFYPANRVVKPTPPPRLDTLTRRKAVVIRQRIAATVVRRAPQVMVKVTGGGRGMAAIAAHFRYISKNGKLRIEDDRGVARGGKEVVKDLIEQWRHSGSLIPENGHRREAFNLMLSMPSGTEAQFVLKAAREALVEPPEPRFCRFERSTPTAPASHPTWPKASSTQPIMAHASSTSALEGPLVRYRCKLRCSTRRPKAQSCSPPPEIMPNQVTRLCTRLHTPKPSR